MLNKLNENLEYGDLKRLVHTELHIDEFKSKMGDDADICVLSFKIGGKEPAADLVNFIEKGYEWVLDADVSSGEKEDGDYLVFVECDRTPELPEKIVNLMNDIMNLTKQDLEEWQVSYQSSTADHPITIETLTKIIPLTVKSYKKKYEKEEDSPLDIDKLKTAAGLTVDTMAPINEYTESLRIAAGIR